jgi:hypothetical protein
MADDTHVTPTGTPEEAANAQVLRFPRSRDTELHVSQWSTPAGVPYLTIREFPLNGGVYRPSSHCVSVHWSDTSAFIAALTQWFASQPH